MNSEDGLLGWTHSVVEQAAKVKAVTVSISNDKVRIWILRLEINWSGTIPFAVVSVKRKEAPEARSIHVVRA